VFVKRERRGLGLLDWLLIVDADDGLPRAAETIKRGLQTLHQLPLAG